MINYSEEEQFIAMQIIFNFYKEQEILFDDLKEAYEFTLKTWNSIQELPHLASMEDLSSNVISYFLDTINENFLFSGQEGYDLLEEYESDD